MEASIFQERLEILENEVEKADLVTKKINLRERIQAICA